MSRLLSIFGLILTLATMTVAPVQEAYAAVTAVTTPIMQMNDSTPCTSQSCAKMPNCPMAVPCLSVMAAIAAPVAKSAFQPAVQILRFAFSVQPELPSRDGGGVRRPPKA